MSVDIWIERDSPGEDTGRITEVYGVTGLQLHAISENVAPCILYAISSCTDTVLTV